MERRRRSESRISDSFFAPRLELVRAASTANVRRRLQGRYSHGRRWNHVGGWAAHHSPAAESGRSWWRSFVASADGSAETAPGSYAPRSDPYEPSGDGKIRCTRSEERR